MKNLQHRFSEILNNAALFSKEDVVLVGVSGGLDSVSLCDLLNSIGQRFAIAHMNFELRGNESQQDEMFVQNLASLYQVPFFLKRVGQLMKESSIQENARDLRYQWFDELLVANKWSYVLTAHHRNDQIETILFQFLRGGTLPALRGMLPIRNNIFRPLLSFGRDELAEYAKQQSLSWREDSSNASDDYQRNYLRHQIIPLLENVNPQLGDSLIRRAVLMRESEMLIDDVITTLLSTFFQNTGTGCELLIADVESVEWPNLLLFHWLKPYGFSAAQTHEAVILLSRIKGSRIVSESHELWHDGDRLSIRQVDLIRKSEVLIATLPFSIPNQIELDVCDRMDVTFEDSKTLFLDHDKIEFPLVLRPWTIGDRFQPYGFTQTKKMSDFLMQKKIPASSKKEIHVLVSGSEIIAVPGITISHHFRITDSTQTILRIGVLN